jgi:glutamate dehydrogenase/leucine dehydrogenase
MVDEYSFLKGHNEFGVITGKPLPLGGSAGRGDATARGGVFTTREVGQALGIKLKGATAFDAVQEKAQELDIHNRLAAYVVAVARVAQAVRLRGWA